MTHEEAFKQIGLAIESEMRGPFTSDGHLMAIERLSLCFSRMNIQFWANPNPAPPIEDVGGLQRKGI
jgi:hypothetical protein